MESTTNLLFKNCKRKTLKRKGEEILSKVDVEAGF